MQIEQSLGSSSTSNGATAKIVAALSGYGEPVDIQAPEVEDYAWGADDHSDWPETGAVVEVGETVEGSIDSSIDEDYFRFQT